MTRNPDPRDLIHHVYTYRYLESARNSDVRMFIINNIRLLSFEMFRYLEKSVDSDELSGSSINLTIKSGKKKSMLETFIIIAMIYVLNVFIVYNRRLSTGGTCTTE